MDPHPPQRVAPPLWPLVVVFVAGCGLYLFARSLIPADGGAAIDIDAFNLLAASRNSLVESLINVISVLGPILAVGGVGLTLLLLARRRRNYRVCVIVVDFLFAIVVSHILKSVQMRPRPSGQLLHAGGYSFPSTDSTIATGFVVTALAAASLSANRRHKVALLAVGFLTPPFVAVMLIAIRVHYFTDVLGGWGLGAAIFSVCTFGGSVLAARGGREF